MFTGDTIVFDRAEVELIVAFAGCSLDEKPGSNWVQDAGGLPEYICEVARAIKRSGKSTSQAISIAVSRMKKWASGVGVDKDTQAKAAAALAEWEKLRAKSHAKSAGKRAEKAVKASHVEAAGFVVLANTNDYNIDSVRAAFDNRMRQQRTDWKAANPTADYYEDGPGRLWVKELWSTFLIAQSSYDSDASLYKIPYTVDTNGEVTFGDPQEVRTQYIAVPAEEVDDDSIDDQALQALAASMPKCEYSPFLNLAAATQPSALDRVLAFAASSSSGSKDAAQKPYGDVSYADPGYQSDGKKRYPIDTADHVRAAWSYINQQSNAGKYSSASLAKVKARIKAAAKKLDVSIADSGE